MFPCEYQHVTDDRMKMQVATVSRLTAVVWRYSKSARAPDASRLAD